MSMVADLKKFSVSALLEQLAILKRLLKIVNNPEYVKSQIADIENEIARRK